jgi:hypothetical protein
VVELTRSDGQVGYMEQRSDGATVVLGMPEFVVGAQLAVGRELWLLVETTADAAGCEGYELTRELAARRVAESRSQHPAGG